MSWTFTVEGQPPSVNRMYRTTQGRVYKDPKVEAYQVLVTYMAKLARPKGWEPPSPLRISYSFFLKRDADCDNLLKALNDAIAQALGINDRVFLPCVRNKFVDGRIDSRVEVEVDWDLPL